MSIERQLAGGTIAPFIASSQRQDVNFNAQPEDNDLQIGLEGIRVIIIEDETLVALMISEMVTEVGAEVVAICTSAPAAIAEIATTSFDIATMDVNINGNVSLGIATVLNDRGVPIVFCTSYGHAVGDISGALVVTKPFTLDDLKQALLAALRRLNRKAR